MNNKRKAIIAIILFVFLGLTIYTFAATPEDKVLDDGTGSGTTVKPDETKKPEESKDNNNTTNNNGNRNNNGGSSLVNNGTNNGSSSSTTVDDSYDKALEAVKTAEDTLTEENYNSAKNLVDVVTDDTKKDELNSRLEEVKNAIDVKGLVKMLEQKTNDSTKKEELDTARDYRKNEEVVEKVEKLSNETLKEELSNILVTLAKKLDDTEAPKVNVNDDDILAEAIMLEITDDNEFTAKLTRDAEEVDVTKELTDGNYILTVEDSSFNNNEIKFTVDTKDPEFNVVSGSHSTTDINVLVSDLTLDYVEVYNQDKKEKTNVEASEINLTDEATYRLTAYDKAGHHTTVWVAIDKTAPVITDVEKYVNHDVKVTVSDKFLTKVTVNGEEQSGIVTVGSNNEGRELVLNLSEEGTYTIVATDKVGNTTTREFTIDKKVDISTVRVFVNGKAAIKGAYYAKAGDTVRVYVESNEELVVAPVVSVEGITSEISYGSWKKGELYAYNAGFVVNENDKNGEVKFTISNYTDVAGNTGILTNNDMTIKTPVVIDTTLPEITVSKSVGSDNVFSYVDLKLHDNNAITKVALNGHDYDRTMSAWSDLNFGNMYDIIEGENTVVLYDIAGNTKEFKFTYDKTIPAAVKVQLWNKDNQSSNYIKNNETIRVIASFTEKLEVLPTVTIGSYTAEFKDAGNNIYTADITIKADEADLAEGNVKFTIENYADKAGNKGEKITEESTTVTKKLVYDRTAPVIKIKDGAKGSNGVYSFLNLALEDNIGVVKVAFNGKEYPRTFAKRSDLNFVNMYGIKEGENTVVLYDAAGNTAEFKFTYDKTAPEITISKSIGTDNIFSYLDLKLHDNVGIAKVSLNGHDYARSANTWSDLNFANMYDIIEGENTVVLYDLAGNSTEYKFTYDKTAPEVTVSYNPTTPTNRNVTVTLTANENVEIVSNSGTWDKEGFNTTFKKVYWNNATQEVTLSDKAGNKTVVKIEIKNIDKEAPVITYENSLTGPAHDPYSYYRVEAGEEINFEKLMSYPTVSDNLDENPTIKIDHVDYLWSSDAKKNIYKYDYSNGLDTKLGTGRFNIYFEATDAAGNVAKKTLLIFIDNITAPVIEFTNASVGSEGYYSTVVVNAKDNDYLAYYEINGMKSTIPNYFTEYGRTFLKGNMNGHIKFGEVNTIVAYDRAGNKSNVLEFVADQTAPVHTSVNLIPSGNEPVPPVNNGARLDFYVFFDEKLVTVPSIKLANGEVLVMSSEYKTETGYKYYASHRLTEGDGLVDGEVKYEIFGYADKAGNVGEVITNANAKHNLSSQSKIIIDRTPATISIGGTTGSKYWKESQDIKVTVTEANLDSIYYAFNGSNNEKSMKSVLNSDKAIKLENDKIVNNGDGTYTATIHIETEGRFVLNVKVVDRAGNVSYARKGWYQIDNQAPIFVDAKPSMESPVTINVKDVSLDKIVVNYKNDNTSYEVENGTVLDKQGYYKIVATDKAGHTATWNLTIDDEAPVITIENAREKNIYNDDVVLNISDIELQQVYLDGKRMGRVNILTVTDEGTHTVKAEDKYSHSTEITFTIDRSHGKITLNGEKSISLELGKSNYNELGAVVVDKIDGTVNLTPAYIHFRDESGNLEKLSDVDTNKIGEYKILYSYTNSIGNDSLDVNDERHNFIIRIVKVVDTTAPEITTLGNKQAKNNHFNKLSLNIKDYSNIASYKINGTETVLTELNKELNLDLNYLEDGEYTLVVKDVFGNENSVSFVLDRVAPKLLVARKVELYVGDEFVEDFYNPEIINDDRTPYEKLYKEKDMGTPALDTSVPGEYGINYGVRDEAGNFTTTTKRIIVKEKPEEKKTTIALNGDNNIEISTSTNYTDLGAIATLPDGTTKEIKNYSLRRREDTAGQYNLHYLFGVFNPATNPETRVPGLYELVYSYDKVTVTRYITVVAD